MKWKRSEVIVVVFLGVLIIAALVVLSNIFLEYLGGGITYRRLEEYVFIPEEPESNSFVEMQESDLESTMLTQTDNENDLEDENSIYEKKNYYSQSPQVDFEALRAQNSDVVGWIYGPDTVINYPIVQGVDNEFYLNHMFDGEKNKCGSIFMDSLNAGDFSNTNSIIHGHHMKNGSMFAGITKYKTQSYYDSHPVFWLVTPEASYQVEIFTGFVTSADSDVWQLEFATKEEYQNWLNKMVDNSIFESDVMPKTDDRILTLATCSYEYGDARFVVMGIMR